MSRLGWAVLLLAFSSCRCEAPRLECNPQCHLVDVLDDVIVDAGRRDAGLVVNAGTCPPLNTPELACTDAPGALLRCADVEALAPGPVLALAANDAYVAFTSSARVATGDVGSVWVLDLSQRVLSCVGRYAYPPLPGGNVLLHDGFVYWTDFDLGTAQGMILRTPLDATDTSQRDEVLRLSAYPFVLRANATHLFWAPLGQGELQRWPWDGGLADAVVRQELAITDFDALDSRVVWATETAVRERLLDGSASSTVSVANGAAHVVGTTGGVVFRDSVELQAAFFAGGRLTLSPGGNAFAPFGVDGTQVTAFDDWAGGALYEVPLDGGASHAVFGTFTPAGRVVSAGTSRYVGGSGLWRLPR